MTCESKCDYDKAFKILSLELEIANLKSDEDNRQLDAHACYIYCFVYIIERGLLFIICP